MTDGTTEPAAQMPAAVMMQLLDVVGDWTWQCDREGRLTFVSDSVERHIGYTPEQLIGTSLFRRLSQDEDERIRRMFEEKRRRCESLVRITTHISHRNGRAMTLEVSAIPLTDAEGRCHGYLGASRDVTAAELVMAEMKRGRSRLAEAQRIAHLGSWELDLVHNELHWSEEIFRIFGIAPEEFEPSYEGFLAVIHPDDRDMVSRAYEESVANHQPYDITHRLLMKDGSIKYVHERCATFYDEENRPIRSTGTVQDVTRQVTLERRLKESEQRFRALVEQSPLSIQLFAADGSVALVNRAWEQLWGADAGLLQGYNILRDRQLEEKGIRSYIERGFAGEACQVPPIVYDPSELPWIPEKYRNTGRWIQAFIYPIKDEQGEVKQLVVMHEDVTDRFLAEQRLKRSEALLSEAQQIAHLGNWELDLATWQATWSDEEYRLLGYRPGEVDASAEKFMQAVHPDDRERVGQAMKEAMQPRKGEERRRYHTVHRVQHGDGRVTVVEEDGWVTFDRELRPLRMFGTTLDITERRRVEQELEQYREHLEQLVERRTEELEATNRELESFAYSVSHDLRAPLRSIDGFSLALLEDYEERLDETGRDYLYRVRRASQRMGALIDDLLMLSRLTRHTLNLEQVDLSALARRLLAELAEAHPERMVETEVEERLRVQADPKLLAIALSNLLENAFKYTAGREPARIEVGSLLQEGGERVYYVRDNGAGFDMQYVDKLFSAFQRLHREEEFPGSGIGLATVARIVHRHGGRVWAEGATGAGASFYFTLGRGDAER